MVVADDILSSAPELVPALGPAPDALLDPEELKLTVDVLKSGNKKKERICDGQLSTGMSTYTAGWRVKSGFAPCPAESR
jgi:hypothetical protein